MEGSCGNLWCQRRVWGLQSTQPRTNASGRPGVVASIRGLLRRVGRAAVLVLYRPGPGQAVAQTELPTDNGPRTTRSPSTATRYAEAKRVGLGRRRFSPRPSGTHAA